MYKSKLNKTLDKATRNKNKKSKKYFSNNLSGEINQKTWWEKIIKLNIG